VNQLELINEVFSLVIAGDDGIPSEDLMEHAMKQGWVLKLSEAFSISHFKERSPMNDAQKSLLKDIQNQILRGYLRDSLPDQATAWKKEMHLKRLRCAHRFAVIFTDPDGPCSIKEDRNCINEYLYDVYMALYNQSRLFPEKMPNLRSDPLHEDTKEMLEDWLLAVLNEMDVDVSEWAGSYLDNDWEFVHEFASHLSELIKPHQPDWQ